MQDEVMTNGFLKVRVKGWETPVCGVKIAEQDEWLILQSCPVDYVLDGFVIIFKDYIENIESGEAENFKFDVIRSCNKIGSTKLHFNRDDKRKIIIKIGQSHEIISILKEFENELDVGLFRSVRANKLKYNYINTKGKIDGEVSIDIVKIRVIEFQTDYLLSLNCYRKKRYL